MIKSEEKVGITRNVLIKHKIKGITEKSKIGTIVRNLTKLDET